MRQAGPATALDELIRLLSKLPGLGSRSAQRVALHLLKNKHNVGANLQRSLQMVLEQIRQCDVCGNFDMQSPCHICTDAVRDRSLLCVVEDVADIWALERNATFGGVYHVLGGTLSAIDGVGPDQLGLPKLCKRLDSGEVKEVIIATNATVDGQTTAHYIADMLEKYGVKVTRPAYGIPIGGELEYLDEGTLSAALGARKQM